MIGRLLDLPESEGVRHITLLVRSGGVWLWVLLALGLLLVVYAFGLYRWERAIGRPWRIVLAGVRALVFVLIVLMLLEPVLAVEATLRVPRRVLVLLDRSESMTLPNGSEGAGPTSAAAASAGGSSTPGTRIDAARALLQEAGDEGGALKQLAASHRLHLYGFGDSVQAVATLDPDVEARSASTPLDLSGLTSLPPDAAATRLGSAVLDAATGQSEVDAVVLFTDGASTGGTELGAAARVLEQRGVPVFIVGFGQPDPPDVRVASMVVQDTLFSEDTAPVRVAFDSTGFDGQEADLVLSLDGEETQRRRVKLQGGSQFERFEITPPDRSGNLQIDANIEPAEGETVVANNQAARTVRVLNEKIHVLYVEGKPRWEYRYLRAVLKRDRRLDVRFLITRGDPDLAAYDPQYIARFPEDAEGAFKYDLVILGDVPASYFTALQLDRLVELVRDRSASLLMIAGHRYAPLTYAGTPIEQLLPVTIGRSGFLPVPEGLSPVVAEGAGEESMVQLLPSPEANALAWSLVRPLDRIADVTAKPAATLLLTLPRNALGGGGGADAREYPLIAWHRVGSGKAMYVGTDALWRLRFKRGDTLHARFWGQATQFLALSRLLGANKRVQIGSDRREAEAGDRVEVFATVLDEAYEPVEATNYTLTIERTDAGDEDAVAAASSSQQLTLTPVPGQPGFFRGSFVPDAAGRYTILSPLEAREDASEVQLDITASPVELRDPALREAPLRALAEQTGGRYLTAAEFAGLPDLVNHEPQTTDVRTQRDLFDLPILFVLLVLLLGVEWFARRRMSLV